ncbi:PhoX family phosphatase [Sinomonas halotolerans]|uniref:PhoX family phosphatase n=1 Tax=Sinomonas halotolerans TaxID=1644133 RepID=A0ABU9WXY9_9MICC
MPAENQRTLLPMLGHVRGKRSAVTCALKCDNACAGEVCNTSKNNYFRDIAEGAISRRSALGLGLAGALTIALTGGQKAEAGTLSQAVKTMAPSKLDFTPIAPVDYLVDELNVPAGYTWKPIIRWGDPLFNDAPEFDAAKQTPEAQARQFGYNNDYSSIIELEGSKGRRAVMFANHEYTNNELMFSAEEMAADPARIRAIARAAHGLTVVELERATKTDAWSYVKGAPRNRRYLLDTPYELTGPAAGSALLKTVADPSGRRVLGTLGNCSGGTTPWGTILSGEENFNGFFRSAGTSAEDKRYGLSDKATRQGWELDDPRFDTRNPGYSNEANRFGYVVEIDPLDPTSTPKKHTMLGRLKHEGANVHVAANGKVVAYTGDDERFDYLYKFVSRDTYRDGGTTADREHNKTLLSAGSLYVAKFEGDSAAEIDGTGKVPSDGAFDGVGQWLPLVVDGKSAIAGMSTEQVLVYTRLAADIAGATKMDRCEDVEPNPITGKVYVACTNNSNRGKTGYAGPDEVNPRSLNRDGHIVEITEDGGDQTATTFTWNLLMLCGDYKQGDAVYFSGFPKEQVSPISCPDNVAFDSQGNLWISTDGAPSGIGYNDGLFKVTLEGAERGKVEQFLSVPRDAETCGPIVRDEERHVFVSVQHPGEDGTFAAPNSYFPDYVPAGTPAGRGQFAGPRPSVVQVLPTAHAK